jgi:branched-chain amino acid transport system substrate-binding protein
MRSARSVAVVLLVVTLLAACGGDDDNEITTNDTIGVGDLPVVKIGAVLSLTGTGGIYGPSQQRGAQLAVDEVNAAGGAGGAQLELVVADDTSDKDRSALETARLVDEVEALALIGPTLSSAAVGAHPAANDRETPMISISASGLGIVGSCPYPCDFIFRDSLGEAAAIPANVKAYADRAHPKTGALIFLSDDKFATDGASVVRTAAPANGIQLVDEVSFPKATTDVKAFVAQATAKKPDVLFVQVLGNLVPVVLKEARAAGFTGQFLGGNSFNAPAASKDAGDAGRGARVATPWHLGSTAKENVAFVKAYKAKYGTDPDQFAAQAYTAILILADAMERAKLDFDALPAARLQLKEALPAARLDTPLGPFSFTADRDVRQPVLIVELDGLGGFKLLATIQPT